MKKLTLILALSIAFASCKKQNNTNTPTTQSSASTSTTTPTSTTTVNDTVGKTRIYFTATLVDVYDTSPFDYKYDTLNTRIRLNQTYLSCTRQITSQGNLGALSRPFTNCIWMGSGDSLVVEFDSLEYNSGGNYTQNYLSGKIQINKAEFNSSGYMVYSQVIDIPLKDWTITSTGTDHNLGLGHWYTSSYPLNTGWYVGKPTKIVYKRP